MGRDLEADARAIFAAGLDAVDPYRAVARALDADDVAAELARFERIVVVGAGKATARMCRAVEERFGDRIAGGAIVVKHGHAEPTARVEVVEAGHPIPDESGQSGTRRIVSLLDSAADDAAIVCLLSGGGSALLVLPADGVTLAEKQEVTSLLLAAGADIGEMNVVRKHLSAVKGGQLARRAAPRELFTFVLSDVVGDRLDTIASGPTVADPSTFADACAILDRHGLWDRIPEGPRRRLAAGGAGGADDTPKPGDPVLARTRTRVVGNNSLALRACEEAARARGYRALLLSSSIEGEAREVARVYAAIAAEIHRSGHPVQPPACVIAGGETTVRLRGEGKGGRNQELALAAALAIDGLESVLVLSAGTDGTDGPTDAAGAVARGDTAARARAAGIDPRAMLEKNDSYRLFEPLGDLLVTGPTGTNVMDVHLILVDRL